MSTSVSLQWTKCAMLKEDEQHQLHVVKFKSEKVSSILRAFFLFGLSLGLALLPLQMVPVMKKNHHIFHPVNPKTKSLLFSAMLQCWVWFVSLYVYQILALSLFQNIINTKSNVVSTAYVHAFSEHWVLCLWDHGCVLPCGIPLPPVVHQHKGDGHGQARSEQETVHAVHAEVSRVCRNGALHASALCVLGVSHSIYFHIPSVHPQ